MTFPLIQHSFLTGEISPELIARTDIEGYKNGAEELYNVFVNYKGGALNRAGTEYCCWCKTSNIGWAGDESTFVPRMIPFVFDADQSLVIVFDGQSITFVRDGVPLFGEVRTITDIDPTDPANITHTGTFTSSVSLLDVYYITGVVGPTELNNRFWLGTIASGTELELYDYFTGDPVDASTMPAYVSGGTISRVYGLNVPINPDHLWSFKYVQSRDVVVLVSPFYNPYLLTRVSDFNWTLTAINFVSSTVAPTGLSLNPSFAGSGTEYTYVLTATDSETGVESEASASANNDKDYWPTNADNIRVEWSAVTGAEFYSVYRAPVIPSRDTPTGALKGLIGQTRGLKFDDHQIGPNFAITPPKTRDPFYATNRYPACTTFIQQRLAFAATNVQPYKIWTTPVGDFTSMNRSQPPRDTDSLEFELASERADPIKNLLSMPGGMLAFTSEAVYHIYGGADGSPLTPNNINADPVSRFGASNLMPLGVGFHVLYTQAQGNLIRDLQYNFFSASYESTDLTLLAEHLFQDQAIMRWAYSNSPWKVVWALRSDGRLLSLTYVPEQNVFAFGLHETYGFIRDVCVIPENGEDTVYLAVARFGLDGAFSGPTASVERMCSRTVSTIETAFFLDDARISAGSIGSHAISISAAEGTGVTVTDIEGGNSFPGTVTGHIIRAGGGMMEITSKTNSNEVIVSVLRPVTNLNTKGDPNLIGPGLWTRAIVQDGLRTLWHLEGQEVYALIDGGVQGPFTVEDGAITFTTPGSYIVIGVAYESRIKSLRLETSTKELPTVQGQRKTIPAVTARMNKSRAIEFGEDFLNMQTWYPRSDENLGQPPDLISGDEYIPIDGTWNEYGQICIRQRDPLPMEVLGLISEVELGDS